jgi:hypothetical protein
VPATAGTTRSAVSGSELLGVAESRPKGGHLARAPGLRGGGGVTVTVDDLFCGAGCSSLGAELGGARLRLGLNHWERAVQTLAAASAAGVPVVAVDR